MNYNIESLTALSENAKFTLLQKAITQRESEVYQEFTEEVFWEIGKELDIDFQGVQKEYKGRGKSLKSIIQKCESQAMEFAKKQLNSKELLDINDYILYDVYGAKIVVLDVSDNFSSKELVIDGFLSKRKKCREKLMKAQEEANKFPNDKNLQEIARLNHVIYDEVNTNCQRYVSATMCRSTMHSKTLNEKFGIYAVPGRFKNHNLSNEYIAQHTTLGSTKLPGWHCEFQFKSYRDYEIARTGEAAHFSRKGKQIVIPNSLAEISEDEVPRYIVYTPEGLYIPSLTECKFHYLEPAFTQKNSKNNENPEKLARLFSEFSESENGIFRKL